MAEKEKKGVPLSAFIVYMLLLYAVWALKEIVIGPMIDENMGDWGNQIISSCIKIAVWIIPAVLLIKKYNDDMAVSLKEMFKGKFSWKPYILIFVIFAAYILIGAWRNFGKIAIHESFHPSCLIGGFLVVGITEELVFRGWLLNAMLKKMSENTALAINALLFLAVHFPKWINDGVFISNFTSLGFLSIMVLSIVFGKTFIKSKSIWVPVALHMFWDLLVFLLYA